MKQFITYSAADSYYKTYKQSSLPAPLSELLKEEADRLEIDKENLNLDNNNEEKEQEEEDIKSKKICPEYKIVEGSLFAVDAFRYGQISHVNNYFLTHFHSGESSTYTASSKII